MRKPQVIPDEDHELIYQRVAAVDVAKASGMVCLRSPDKGGRYHSKVWEVCATTAQVLAAGRELLKERVEMVTLEATSDYWRIWYYLLESLGLAVQLVSPDQARNLKGRPKTDRLDAMWLARLTQWGMLHPCFVPPHPVRVLRDYARARADLVRDRTRCWQRLEKLLEGALIKISSVASRLTTASAQDMIRALIAGERDPHKIASLARGRMRAKHAQLAEALDGMFGDHHGVLAEMELDRIADLDARIAQLEDRAAAALRDIPQSWGADADGTAGPDAGTGPDAAVLPAVLRLAEIPGVSITIATEIIAETGLDMARFHDAGHLVSWAGLCRSAAQSGPRNGKGRKKHGNTYLRAALGRAAVAASHTDTFLGERYRRIARRRSSAIAQTAVARSILVIIWHLLADRGARFRDLGPDWHTRRADKDKKIRSHIRQLQALGLDVTVTPKTA
ncbi:MAG TPA: IS110 family transposase [Streptosporangiaceae bacterium]|nr:IS110 family transposase [Streptosporangiaceae bacterium]